MVLMLLGLCFVVVFQPIMMVLIMILISLLYSLVIFKVCEGYWFSYIFMMVILSGVLVVFTYMVSLIPNEMFELNGLLMFIVVMVMSIYNMVDFMYIYNMSFISLNIWISVISLINLFLISFLLMVMLMVVWFSYMKYGAIRIIY